jgi:glycosyltransferase involved in cell wall biosynthesis
MRILAITDCYPPYHMGGFGLRAKELLDRLRNRGHTIAVVTTRPPRGVSNRLPPEGDISRRLSRPEEPVGWKTRILDEMKDVTLIKRKVESYRPELIYLLHICDLTKTLFPYLAGCSIPLVYDEGTIGMPYSYGRHGFWFRMVERNTSSKVNALVKPVLINACCAYSGGALKKKWVWPANMRGYFNTEWGRQNAKAAGMPTEPSTIIPSGLNTELFGFTYRAAARIPPSIILPGRIEPEKGQHEAVRLLATLHQQGVAARLTLFGHVRVTSYLQEIEKDVHDTHLDEYVDITPSMLDYEQLPPKYRQADICFFPSYWKSGLSRVPLEAMASGCVVISYGNEGSDQIIKNGETGYLIPEGDIGAAVNRVGELIAQPATYRMVTKNARAMIESRHALEPYVDKIEAFLVEAVNAGPAATG